MKKLIKLALFSLVLTLSIFSCQTTESEVIDKPNILFFLIDDQRNDLISCAGHPIVKTPTVDLLAKNGTRFTNAFVTTSICAASRASILTGLYEHKHNYTFEKDPIAKSIIENSYPYLLKKEGYQTGFVGKLGVKMEDQDSLLSHLFDYYKFSEKNTPGFVEMPDGTSRHSAEVKGDQAIDFIKQQSDEQPFCLSISFNAVHAVDGNKTPGNEGHYPYPKAVANMYEGIEMPQPNLADPAIYENHPDFLKQSLNRERFFWRWDTPEKYQTNMRAYYRMISGYDQVMKRVLAELLEKGLAENTIIIYTADNGYYMGNRGFAGKWSHYEESLRVPLIIYDPRNPSNGIEKKIKEMALNIDLPATMLELAGVTPPTVYQGKSLVPLLSDNTDIPWREHFLCEHRMEHPQIPKFVGLRGKRFVYANYYEQEPAYEYLHDLQKDPNQLDNLANEPAYKKQLDDMRRKCDDLAGDIVGKEL